MTTAQTAAEYRARYLDALEHKGLTQYDFHKTADDGRHLACALGVIGEDVDNPEKCPAAIMPLWLALLVPKFFDNQEENDAFAWGDAFTAELARLDSKIPLSVIHDWHAETVCPMAIASAEKLGKDPAPHKASQALHRRALAGESINADEWRPVLRNAYAYNQTYTQAYAAADAAADAYVDAYADADAVYADAYAAAYTAAYTAAAATSYTYADAWKILAYGMIEALKRVPSYTKL